MQVKVWNDNIYPLKQYFKGNHVMIEAKGFIEMEFYEAVDFVGAYLPFERDASGQQDPKSFKMCRIDKGEMAQGLKHKLGKHICLACAHESPSKEELKAHVDHKHANDPRLKLEEVDSFLASDPVDTERLKAEMRDSLKSELLAEIRAEMAAERPAAKKPKKEASA